MITGPVLPDSLSQFLESIRPNSGFLLSLMKFFIVFQRLPSRIFLVIVHVGIGVVLTFLMSGLHDQLPLADESKLAKVTYQKESQTSF